jgi:hypothetical protein
MRAPQVVAALALLGGGCRSELLAVDGGAGDGPPARCEHHQLRPVALTGIGTVDPPGSMHLGALVRFAVGYLRSPCDLPGPIALDIQPGNATAFATVTAHLWVSDRSDCGAKVGQQRLLSLDSSTFFSPYLQVKDGVSGVVTTFTLSTSNLGGDCSHPVMLGGACLLDCQCEATFGPARCVPFDAQSGRCAVPCTEDVDCPDDLPRCGVGGGPPFTCGTGSPCASDGECPFGQSCTQVPMSEPACRAAQVAPGGNCGCGSDCSFGYVCQSGRCVAPCVEDADCSPTSSPRGAGSCDPGTGACNPFG